MSTASEEHVADALKDLAKSIDRLNTTLNAIAKVADVFKPMVLQALQQALERFPKPPRE